MLHSTTKVMLYRFVLSFESGRRCPTGPGIYAFRCTRAQNLFNLLQSRVRNPYIDGPYVESPHPDTRPRENQAPRLRPIQGISLLFVLTSVKAYLRIILYTNLKNQLLFYFKILVLF